MVLRNRRHPFLGLFDGADPNASTPERQVTTVPTQALYFMNDPFFHQQAAAFADRLLARPEAEPRGRRVPPRVPARPDRERDRASAARFLTRLPRRAGRRARRRPARARRGPPTPACCSAATNSSTRIDPMPPSPLAPRTFLRSAVAGSLLMPGILHELLAADSADPLAPRKPHFPAKAKSVIFLFMSGGVSHVDSFDPKPHLFADHGKQVDVRPPRDAQPARLREALPQAAGLEVRPARQERHRGQRRCSRTSPSCVDDIAVIRSMHTSHSNHYNATLGMHTGSFTVARPSIGSWLELRPRHGEPQPALVPRPRPADALRRARRCGRRTSCPVPTRGRASSRAPSRCRTSSAACPSKRQELELAAPEGSQRGPRRDAARRRRSSPRASSRSRRPSGCSPRCPRRSTWPRRATRRSASTA